MPIRWLVRHRLTLITLGLVMLGLTLRSYHYLRQPPVWHDEASVLVNILDKECIELIGPLQFDASGPPLFLFLERAAFVTLGDSTLALRLVPFLASCFALLLIVYLARRTLPPTAVPWAVLLFACSETLLWHTCEAKPYSSDIFVATLLASVYVALRDRPVSVAILALTPLAPFALLLSYPAALVYGGLLITLGLAVWKERKWTAWLLLAGLTTVVIACFVWVALVPGRAQQTPALVRTWTHCFPDWEQPWTVPVWVLTSCLEVCRYCCKPLGQTLVGFLAIGVVGLYRNGRRDLLLVLGLPILLALLAALDHRYPFGGVRVMAYSAPAVILLIAAGVPPTIAWLRARFRFGIALVAAVLLLPAGMAAKDVLFPWAVADPAGAAEYVEAHRLPADQVVGNDWTHFYYFHHLGSRFIPAGKEVAMEADGRVWVVVTSGPEMSAEERLHLAAGWTPSEWTQRPVAEFNYTTVVLASRP